MEYHTNIDKIYEIIADKIVRMNDKAFIKIKICHNVWKIIQ
jgi:hypothetical protein